jgi:hypothetical protein
MKMLWSQNWHATMVWAAVVSISLQVVFGLVAFLGFREAAYWCFLPGLYPILWATHGWFSSLTPLGNAVLLGTKFVVYYSIVWATLGIHRLVVGRSERDR